MILLLGASGYIGQAFARELQRRQWPFQPLSRSEADYTRFDVLLEFLKKHKPAFLVNAAGYTGKPNVDACEVARADTLAGNALLPQTLAQACAVSAIPGTRFVRLYFFRGQSDVERANAHGKGFDPARPAFAGRAIAGGHSRFHRNRPAEFHLP
jgi:nucleoside-diphosphate-sugar epimerase